MGAYAYKPVILMSQGETGYETLLGAGLVPPVPSGTVATWENLIATIDSLISMEKLDYKTLVLDAMGGYERMCHEYVCQRDFAGQWGDKGFGSYQKGYDLSINEWLRLLNKLDQLRGKGIMILLLAHSKIITFKNPLGPDYDMYTADVQAKTTGATNKWASAVLFGDFVPIIDKVRDTGQVIRGKAIGTEAQRIIYTEHSDARDAKNQYGLPAEIEIPNEPEKAWATLWQHIVPKTKTTNGNSQKENIL